MDFSYYSHTPLHHQSRDVPRGKLFGLAEFRVFTTYSAESESEYLRRQNMNSKLGEEQKKGHHVRRSPKFDPNSDKMHKKGQNDNGLILGRVPINTRPSPSNALLLGRVLGLCSAHPYISPALAKVCTDRWHHNTFAKRKKSSLPYACYHGALNDVSAMLSAR